jgi:hypothetical protein
LNTSYKNGVKRKCGYVNERGDIRMKEPGQEKKRYALCYTLEQRNNIAKGMFYVIDEIMGERYKAAPTKDEAMENWKAGMLQ